MEDRLFTYERVLTFSTLLLSLVVCFIHITNAELTRYSLQFLTMTSVFVVTGMLCMFIPKYFRFIILLITICFCSMEIIWGLSQLLGLKDSNHDIYAITGSFLNPGPYGGFLSVCASIMLAFCVGFKDAYNKTIISKVFIRIVLVVALLAIAILPSTQSRSALIAVGCGLLMVAVGNAIIKAKMLSFLKKNWIWFSLIVSVIIVGTYLIKKPSADGRFFMDRICVKAICSNGWKGAGIGHFGSSYGEAQARYFKKQINQNGQDDLDWSVIDEHERLTADCPDNAFNEYLFVGVEAGPVAMILFICLIITAIGASYKKGTIWCYGLAALAVFALFSYPFHIKRFQWIFALLLSACFFEPPSYYASIRFSKESKRLFDWAAMIVSIIVLSGTIIMEWPKIEQYKFAEKAWSKVERWYQGEYYDYVVEDSYALLPYMKYDIHFLFAYGQSLNKIGEYENSTNILKMGTEISSDPMFWNVMGNNSLALGRYREAEECYKHAFYMVPNRLYPLYLLAKLYHEEGDSAKFLDMADKVDSLIPKVESKNTKRLRDEINEKKTGNIQ